MATTTTISDLLFHIHQNLTEEQSQLSMNCDPRMKIEEKLELILTRLRTNEIERKEKEKAEKEKAQKEKAEKEKLNASSNFLNNIRNSSSHGNNNNNINHNKNDNSNNNSNNNSNSNNKNGGVSFFQRTCFETSRIKFSDESIVTNSNCLQGTFLI